MNAMEKFIRPQKLATKFGWGRICDILRQNQLKAAIIHIIAKLKIFQTKKLMDVRIHG